MAGQVLSSLKRDCSDQWCCYAETLCWTVHGSELAFFGFAYYFLGKQWWLCLKTFEESWAGDSRVVWGGKEGEERESAIHQEHQKIEKIFKPAIIFTIFGTQAIKHEPSEIIIQQRHIKTHKRINPIKNSKILKHGHLVSQVMRIDYNENRPSKIPVNR